ncbi:MAG: helix-turn-helix transcriptional regulator [Pseudomonadota bacterium]
MNMQDELMQFAENTRFALYNLPGIAYIKDLNSHYIECSRDFEKILKVRRAQLIHRLDDDFSWASYAEEYRHNDQATITKNKSDTLDPIPLGKKLFLSSRCIKQPIYNKDKKIIGIFGRAEILSTNHTLNEAMSCLSIIDKKNIPVSIKTYQVDHYGDDLKLTSRETECLFLLIRGKSVKEMAQFLTLSPRTVEVYIENIKLKMEVSSRSQIIDKAIELKLFEIIPKNSVFADLRKNAARWKDVLSTI